MKDNWLNIDLSDNYSKEMMELLEMNIINHISWIINQTITLWFMHDSRDARKVDYLHEELRNLLYFFIDRDVYDILLEWKIEYDNMLDSKDCDIVIVNKNNIKTNNWTDLQWLQEIWKGWNTVITSWVEEIISVKNPISSYKKNARNYKESMIWEAVNLKLADIRYTHFMFLSDKIPTYTKDGDLIRLEEITEKEIRAFKKLKNVNLNNGKIIDDFVTFLYNIERYNTEYINKSDLISDNPNATLYVKDINEIRYTFYFFEYLKWFIERYWNLYKRYNNIDEFYESFAEYFNISNN